MESNKIKTYLVKNVTRFNKEDFIKNDPISIPHSFTKKEDIEISAFFASIFAWGRRDIIIKKSKEILKLMDNSPHDFIINHTESDYKIFENFKHRTFNYIDTIYFLRVLNFCYKKYKSLEDAFRVGLNENHDNIEIGLINFHKLFFSLENYPQRTIKHISTPNKNSACKRINMFLRWMVRKDKNCVDFGIWEKIKPSQLIIPCDVHVIRVANKIGLINSEKANWKVAVDLTNKLKKFDFNDPTKYDFALFSIGVNSLEVV